MAQESLARAFGLTEHLYSALSLAERASCLRQAGNGGIGSKADTSRAAATLDRWKSQKPFTAGDSFEKRLRLDGLTEQDLLVILGLPSEVYSELIASPRPEDRFRRRRIGKTSRLWNRNHATIPPLLPAATLMSF
jgi:hypothetical protein